MPIGKQRPYTGFASRDAVAKLRLDGTPTPRSLGGSVELRRVPGTWQLLAVDRHGPRAGSAEAQLASTPTPGPRAAMRRSDRAVVLMARRTPWILLRDGPPRPDGSELNSYRSQRALGVALGDGF
jgi:hypothetical protein